MIGEPKVQMAVEKKEKQTMAVWGISLLTGVGWFFAGVLWLLLTARFGFSFTQHCLFPTLPYEPRFSFEVVQLAWISLLVLGIAAALSWIGVALGVALADSDAVRSDLTQL